MALSDVLFEACEGIRHFLSARSAIDYDPAIGARLLPLVEEMDRIRRELDAPTAIAMIEAALADGIPGRIAGDGVYRCDCGAEVMGCGNVFWCPRCYPNARASDA